MYILFFLFASAEFGLQHEFLKHQFQGSKSSLTEQLTVLLSKRLLIFQLKAIFLFSFIFSRFKGPSMF